VEPGVVYAGTATQPTHRIGDGKLVNLSNGESASELRFVAADAVTHELELERAKRYGSGVTLVFFDLDDFKELNDTHCHQAGDRALQQVAQLLRDEIRESDLAGRMGGDEFAALLVESDNTGETFLERLEARIGEVVESGVLPVPVGLSAGLTRYPDDGEDAQALFALADLRLYEARRTSAA
jgi:diguanylate cyclase (GGDEF)-like protein